MAIILCCTLFAVILPYLAKAPVAYAMSKLNGYDNRHPRAQQAQLTGFGARALAAHQNCFESLIVYGVAISVVLATNSVNLVTETLAIIYVVSRVLYCICYYVNWHVLRSTIWFIGLFSPLAMIWQSI